MAVVKTARDPFSDKLPDEDWHLRLFSHRACVHAHTHAHTHTHNRDRIQKSVMKEMLSTPFFFKIYFRFVLKQVLQEGAACSLGRWLPVLQLGSFNHHDRPAVHTVLGVSSSYHCLKLCRGFCSPLGSLLKHSTVQVKKFIHTRMKNSILLELTVWFGLVFLPEIILSSA